LRGKDISLRRAPGASISAPPPQPQFSAVAAAALRNATNQQTKASSQDDPFDSSVIKSMRTPDQHLDTNPVKSFAQRIAEQRNDIQEKVERNREIEKNRSKGWDKPQSSGSGTGQVSQIGQESSVTDENSRSGTSRLTTTRSINPNPPTTDSCSKNNFSDARKDLKLPAIKSAIATQTTEPNSEDSSFDTFSCFHLSKRIIPHTQLARQLASKSLYPLPTLLKTVVSPEYEPPDVSEDWVVLGIICSKSLPRDVARENAGKYMAMTLTDLKWEVNLLLFGQSFEKYYKIGVGTVIALLNPGIMKPRIKDSGKFSLSLSDASDSLMEIGVARDIGYCKARKKDGQECGTWVDIRHTEFCAYHVEQGISKHRAGRMEINTMSKMYSPPRKGQSIRPKKSFLRGSGGGGRDDGLLPEGPILDLPERAGGAGGKIFVTNVSTARLIDGDHTNDVFNQGDKAERMRKHLAKLEKERDVTKRLLESQDRQHNAGVEYLRMGLSQSDAKSGRIVTTTTKVEERAFSASNIRTIGFDPTRRPGSGLSKDDGNSDLVRDFVSKSSQLVATDVSLSPVKLKRKQSVSSLSTIAPISIGGGLSSPTSTRAPPSKKSRVAEADTKKQPLGWGQRPVLGGGGGLHQKGVERSNMGSAHGTSSSKHLAPSRTLDKETKSVKFAPMPSVASNNDNDDDDDLEITGWAG